MSINNHLYWLITTYTGPPIIDSRGLARALIGDIEGAIIDFQVYVDWTSNEEKKAQRQEWIKALQAGENPCTDELLKDLRS